MYNLHVKKMFHRVYHLYINDILYYPINNDDYRSFGIYFHIKIDYENAEKYYLMAINRNRKKIIYDI